MKKLLTGALALSLALGMSALPALAQEGLEDRNIDVQARYQDGSVTPTVYSVDIAWGEMQFTYNKSGVNVWNPATHEYKLNTDDSWTASGNGITVKNHSNTGVTARLSYASDAAYQTVAGSFNRSELILPSAVGTAVENAPSGASALTLSGTLPEGTTLTKVGAITITLAGA